MLGLGIHLGIAGGLFAAILVLAQLGNALQAAGVLPATAGWRLTSMILFGSLSAALAFAAVPVIVKLVLGFQRRAGNAGASLPARERLIVFVLWVLLGLGLAVAVPAAILSGAFDQPFRTGTLMSSQPSGVTAAVSPGRSSTVVISLSTIAGPAIAWPGASASKPQTGAATHSSSQMRRSPCGLAGGAGGRAGSCGSSDNTPDTATRALTSTVSWPGSE